jgi:hypothetical protein
MDPMDDEPLFTVGVEEPPERTDDPPGRPRWWLLVGLVVVLAGLLAAPGLVDRLEDDPAQPEADPLDAPDYRPPAPSTPGWVWTELAVDWGNEVVDLGSGLLVGARTWERGGGSWTYHDADTLAGAEPPIPLGELPRHPVATFGTDGRLLVAGLREDAVVVEAIDLATGRREAFEPAPQYLVSGPDAIAEREGWVYVDGGNRLWSRSPTGAWTVDDGVDALTIAPDLTFAFGVEPDAIELLVTARDADFRPIGSITTDRPPGRVLATSGPFWTYLESCFGSECERFARPLAGNWARAPELPGLPRWNGSEWWVAGPWAAAGATPVRVSSDALTWETVATPALTLTTDEQVLVNVLPGSKVVLTVLRPDGSSEVFLGERA